jgi:class 3 adenylate cyclase
VTTRPDGRERRNAAILMLDIVGFSLMVGRNEEEAASRVIKFHDDVERLIADRRGRVIDTAGDSVFALFDSVTDAVECAAEIQRRLAADPRADRMVVRIGIHRDEVVLDGGRAFGEGVNIAARLQQIAPPGGIAVSEDVHDAVAAMFPFEDQGHRSLKNIAGRVRVHMVAGTEFGFPEQPVPRAFLPSGFSDLAESFAFAVEDRLLARGFDPNDDERPEPAPPVHPRRLIESRAFWVLLALGSLLIAGHLTGWTSNGLYPLIGVTMTGGAFGRLAASITGRGGFRALAIAISLAAGALFLSGAISRAIAWVIAAALVGPGVAGLRKERNTRYAIRDTKEAP